MLFFGCNILIVTAKTIIVPKTHLNHRLTLSGDKPMFINSALNASTLENDYFKSANNVTNLIQKNKRLCVDPKTKKLDTCSKDSRDLEIWGIEDVVREVRLKTADGYCVSVGDYNSAKDQYSAKLSECDRTNNAQVFILHGTHGSISSAAGISKNPNAPKVQSATPNMDSAMVSSPDSTYKPKREGGLRDDLPAPTFDNNYSIVPSSDSPNARREKSLLLE